MSRALGPRAPVASSAAAPGWIVLGACWIIPGLALIPWAGAKIAAALAGGHVAGFGFAFAADLAARRTRAAWPGVPTALVITCTAVIAVAVAAAIAAAWIKAAPRLLHAADDPVAALHRDRRRHAPMTLPAVAERAAHLRASLRGLPPGQIAEHDAGMLLGDVLRPGQPPGPAVYADWRDTEIDIMGPGAGKTTARAIPLTLSAPGPAVATSNKPDLWAATHAIRGRRGPAWLFDPCSICSQPQTFWVDILAPVTRVEPANRLASHFVLTVEDPGKRELWGPAAQTLLSGLFLAAAISGRTLHDVAMWLDQPAMPAPAGLLQKAGFAKLASSLTGTQNGAPETRDGIYETARTAAKALRDDETIKWVTPQPGLPMFRPGQLLRSTGTLYLLSESLSYAAPLIAAVADGVIRAGIRLAQMAGGRLDPPVPIVLDEAANICRIADLPNLYSYLGSHGLCPVTILQSYEQGITVWGESGMAALWGAATVKLIGAGVDSPRLARDLATLVGQHDVPVRSITIGEGRGASEQISLRRQDILEPADVAALGKGLALLRTSGNRPGLIQLRNWFTGPHAAQIQAEVDRALQLIQAGAAARDEVPL
jgi:TraM recognition site of TraD and TraG